MTVTSLRTLAAVADLAVTVTGDRFTRLTGLAVPYNTPVDVGPFIEDIAPGTFSDSLRAVPALPLHLFHGDVPGQSDSTPWPIGVAERWDDRADGLHGVWNLDHGDVAQEAARMVKDGLLTGLSVRFLADPDANIWSSRTSRSGKDRVRRTRARLVSVSLVSAPAYPGAVVTSVRSAAEHRAALDQVRTLAMELGNDLVNAAITGTPDDMRTTAGIVWAAIAAEGATAARAELEEMAATLHHTRPQLAVNLARAAQCIDRDHVTEQLRNAHVDQYRALLPAATDRPAPPPRRRRRTT